MRYTRRPRGSTAAASCLNTPIAGWLTGFRRAGRVALPHEPVLHLLAGQPGAPGRSAAGAVLRGSARMRYASATSPSPSKRIAEAPPLKRLRVRGEDPAAVLDRERGGSVRGRRASDSRFPPPARRRARSAWSGSPQGAAAQLVRRAPRAVAGARAAAAPRTPIRTGRPRTRNRAATAATPPAATPIASAAGVDAFPARVPAAPLVT